MAREAKAPRCGEGNQDAKCSLTHLLGAGQVIDMGQHTQGHQGMCRGLGVWAGSTEPELVCVVLDTATAKQSLMNSI